MVCAGRHSRTPVLKIIWIVCAVMLRLFAPAAVALAAVSDAPPPPAEDHFAVADDAGDDDGDDPSDVDDGDDDPDDAALPAAVTAIRPRATARPATWRLVTLTDQDCRDPLFRPPRAG